MILITLIKKFTKNFRFFTALGYTISFIASAKNKAKRKFLGTAKRAPQPENVKTIAIPYFSGLEKLKQPFLVNNIRLVFTFPNTIVKLLVKNSPKVNLNSGVYLIPCAECPQVYIGETKRELTVRIGEHKRDCRMGTESNAVYVHSSSNNHAINWEGSKIIFKATDKSILTFMESIFIKFKENFNLSPGFNVTDEFTSNFIWSVFKLSSTCD